MSDIMRTTLTLDADVAALIELERQRTGESRREVTNRLLRQGLQQHRTRSGPVELPTLPGRPRVDITDTSEVLAADEDEHLAAKGRPTGPSPESSFAHPG